MTFRPDAPPLTREHYRNLPETGPRYQLIEGDLHMAPAPNRFHQDISRNVQRALDRFLEENQLGVVYDAPFDVYLTETDVFLPDLSVFLQSNRDILTDAGAEGVPDLVVEILSPKTRKLDLENKKRVYSRLGLKELWIIDPEPGKISIYRFGQDPEQPVEVLYPSGVIRTPFLPGFTLAAQAVFRRA